jgi:NADH-quinone oxidoreductase subunit E
MDTKELVQSAVKKHGTKRESLLPILQDVCEKQRYLTKETMQEIAKSLDISSADVYGTASFYSFLETEERGENIIRICRTITCDMKGKKEIVKALEERLSIKVGDTTRDKKFSLLETNCLGWCHKGPAMLINDKVYTELTPEKAVTAVEEYMN